MVLRQLSVYTETDIVSIQESHVLKNFGIKDLQVIKLEKSLKKPREAIFMILGWGSTAVD